MCNVENTEKIEKFRYNVIHVLRVKNQENIMSTALSSVSLRLPNDLIQRLSDLAQKTGRSRTFYMQQAIKQHIEDLEDLYDAEQALIDIRAGKSSLHSLEDVEKALGLDS